MGEDIENERVMAMKELLRRDNIPGASDDINKFRVQSYKKNHNPKATAGA